MKRSNQGWTVAGRSKRWAIALICLLLLSICASAGAESKLVSVASLTVPTETSQYSTVSLSAALTYEGAPAGEVEFAVKKNGASAYTVLGKRPVAATVTLSATDGFTAVGAYTVRARYVPAGGETDFIAGTEQYQTVNVRGARTSAELATAMANGTGARTITMDADLTLTDAIQVKGDVTLTGGHTLTRGAANTGFTLLAGSSLTVIDTVIDGASIQGTHHLFTLANGSKLTLSEGAHIKGVLSDADGSVVYVPAGGQVELTQTALIENCTTTGRGTLCVAGGGTLTMTDSARVSNCKAAQGGAVYLSGATAALDGSATITGCTATGDGGGIMAVSTSGVTLSDDATITSCASDFGGGVSASGSTLTMQNRSSIAGNTAKWKGGGALLLNQTSSLSMSGSASISGNKTTDDTSAFWGGGGVRLEAGATATMTDNATVANNIANYDGGGFNIDDRAVLTMSGNASVTGNQAKIGYGGGVNVDNGATLTLTGNSTISKNTAKRNGGGVDLDGLLKSGTPSPAATTATLSDYASITGNVSEERGGGIMVYKYCTLTLNDSAVISDNSAVLGGGIYVEGVNTSKTTYDQTIVNLTGGSVSGNTATNNGGGVLLYYGTLNMQNGSIVNNKATLRGGGVHIEPACSVVTMEGASMIADNEAGDDGGGLSVVSGNYNSKLVGGLTMRDTAAILNNKAAQSGGGIFLTFTDDDDNVSTRCDAFDVTMSGHASVSGNEAGYGSGGYENDTWYYGLSFGDAMRISHLYLSGSANLSGNVKADFYYGNLLKSDNVYILINGRYTGSCGIYYSGTSDLFLNSAIAYWEGYTPASDQIASYEAYCFYNNNDIDGHFEKRDSWEYLLGHTATRKNVYLKQSGAQRRISEYYASSDAALADYTYHDWRANIKNCFDNFISSTSHQYLWMQVNSPETVGETMKIPSGKVLTITGAQITRAAGFKGSMFQVLPGGMLILDGVRLDGGGVTGCSPLVVVEDGSTLTMRNGATLANNVCDAAGGAIYGKDDASTAATSSIYILSGAVITGNKSASGAGGGVYSAGIVAMTGGSIGKNTATDGGGIYATGRLTMTGGSVAGNTAGASGGGVYLAGTGNLTGGLIEKNTATANIGGGVCVAASGELTMTGGQIRGNTANTGGGGVATDANAYIQGGVINGNKAATGGGVCVRNGKTALLSGSALITDNEATGNGGGVAGGAVTMRDSARVAHNKADGDGGGVYADVSVGLSETATIDGNSAANGGGVYYAKGSSSLLFAGGTISGNTATGDGGGVYLKSKSAMDTLPMIFGSAKITGNTAAGKGGGLYVGDNLTVSASSLTLSENKAESGAGMRIGTSTVSLVENTSTGTGATVAANIASGYGAGILINGGTLTIEKATISGNTADVAGGGIHSIYGNLTIKGGTQLTGNRAFATCGGGVYLQSGTATIADAAIQKNTAPAGGGVEYATGASSLTLGAGASIDQNSGYDGGRSNLHMWDNKLVTLTDAAMTGKIGVTPATGASYPLQITQGVTATQQTADAFSDDTEQHVTALLNGNVVLGAGNPAVRVEIGGLKPMEFDNLPEAFAYTNSNASLANPATITLLKDMEVSAALRLNGGVKASIAGYSIKRSAAYGSAAGYNPIFSNYGVLTLGAITLDGSNTGSSASPMVHNDNMCQLTIDGAVLRNNVSPAGAVANYGLCEMLSGTITDCSCARQNDAFASAIWNACNLILTGGSITGNTDANACVRSQDAISGVKATLTLGGTVITDNGAGVKHSGTGALTLSGQPVVANNTAYNLYLPDGVSATVSGTLGDGTRIGVTTQTPPVPTPVDKSEVLVATGAPATATALITSDNPLYVTSGHDNKIFLTLGGRTVPAPTAASVTSNSVTLNAVTPSVSGTGDVIEYGWMASPTANPTSWQTSPTFTGLTPSTTYYFKARVTQGTQYPDAVSPSSAAIVTSDAHSITLTLPSVGIASFETSPTGADGSWTTYTASVTVSHGSDLYVKANLATGYSFDQWADGLTANPQKLAGVTADMAFTPTVSLNTHTVTLTKPASGITSFETSPTGADGSWTTYAAPVAVNHGSDLYIKAKLAYGYSFVKWADGLTANPQKLAGVTADMAFTPTVSLNTHTVTLTLPSAGITSFETSPTGADGSWTTYAAPVVVNHGSDLYIKANLAEGYSFVKWADGLTANPQKLTSVTADMAFTPTVTLNTHTVTLTKPSAGVTSFETSPTGADGSWTTYAAPVVVNHGSDLYIKAKLADGYSFVKWADGLTANPQKLEAITADMAFTPTVTLNTYTVTYDDNGATTAHSGGDTTYTVNTTTFTLPTAPQKTTGGVAHTFAGWKVTTGAAGGTGFATGDVLTGASRALNGAYGNVTLTAQWSTEPVITEQPTDQSVVEGEQASFSIVATGIPAPTYQWQVYANGAWTNVAGATGATYTTEAATQAMNGAKYRCLVSNSFKRDVPSNVVTLTVRTKPIDPPASDNRIVGIQAGDRFTKGDKITFTAIGGGMDNQNPARGDLRWKPLRWSTNPKGTFDKSDTATFDTKDMTTGAHILTVWFGKQRWDGSAWMDVSPAVTDVKTVQYTLVNAPVPPATGDGSALGLWALLCLTALLCGTLLLKKRSA